MEIQLQPWLEMIGFTFCAALLKQIWIEGAEWDWYTVIVLPHMIFCYCYIKSDYGC